MPQQEVFEGKIRVDEAGLRYLQCHSRGDTRFSPFYCYTTVYGSSNNIENHFQRAKQYEDFIVNDWRDAKKAKEQNLVQTGWKIGEKIFPVITNDKGIYLMKDWGIQFYIALWYKYLRTRGHLIEYAAKEKFDGYEDPFAGTFPFCQAKLIQYCVKNSFKEDGGIDANEGIHSLLELCRPLLKELRKPRVM